MTVTQYLGTGSTSRGRLTITRQLNTIVSTPPYLRTDNDKAAVIQSLISLQQVLKPVVGLTWITPKPNVTAEQFIASVPAIPARRGSNHWTGELSVSLFYRRIYVLTPTGTAKIGSDDGRNNGTAVVDLNTKVYGTDNLFVVDASIFPGMITANPSAAIVIVAEHAAKKILALA